MHQQYQDFAKAREPQSRIFKNCIRAFISGGIICTIGQGIQWVFITYFKFDGITSGSPTVAVLVFISVSLTCFGVYDHLAQWGGAGTAAVGGPFEAQGALAKDFDLLSGEFLL